MSSFSSPSTESHEVRLPSSLSRANRRSQISPDLSALRSTTSITLPAARASLSLPACRGLHWSCNPMLRVCFVKPGGLCASPSLPQAQVVTINSNATQPASAAGCSRASRVAWPTTRLSSLRPISFRREGMGLSWQGRGTETEGLIPEREPEKRLSHPRKAAGAQSTQTRQRKVVRRINNTEHPCHVTGLERVEVKGAMGCCKAAALVGLRGR